METKYRHRSKQNLWDKIWKDKNGKLVIWQFPNPPLWAWAGFTTLSLLFSGLTSDIFSWIGSASLIYWALLEIIKGDSYFRRLLGLIVLFYSVTTLIRSF